MAPDISLEIIKEIQTLGFKIIKNQLTVLSQSQCETLYSHYPEEYRKNCVHTMQGLISLVLEVEGESAIKVLQERAGVLDSRKNYEQDIKDFPDDILSWKWRSKWGKDIINNAVYISDNGYNVLRDKLVLFPESLSYERTLAIV